MSTVYVERNKLNVSGKVIPRGHVEIIKILLREGPITAFKIMELTGKAYIQYTQSLLRILVLYGIVVKVEVNKRPAYEVNPEIKEELRLAIEEMECPEI